MEREELKILAKGINSVYGVNGKPPIPDQYAFDMWYALLKDLDYTIASEALRRYMQSAEFAPKPSNIRSEYAKLIAGPEESLTETEVWSKVYKAIQRASYYSKEEYDKLPPAIQRAVGSPENLREWAQTDTGDMTVVQSNVMRAYRATESQNKDFAVISEGIAAKTQERIEMGK